MAINYFELPYQNKMRYLQNASLTENVIELNYGGGYRQVAANGMNSSTERWTVYWTKLTQEELKFLVGSIKGVATNFSNVFYWESPLENEFKLWYIKTYNVRQLNTNYWEVQAELQGAYIGVIAMQTPDPIP